MTKMEWRAELQQRLQTWCDSPEHKQSLLGLTARITALLRGRFGVWAAFRALPSEPNMTEAIAACPHLEWAYPVVDGQSLRWLRPGPRGFHQAAFGISEPVVPEATEVAPSELRGVLVPAIGFDENGTRLGRGRGFYDRALAECAQALKVGVAFDCQVVEKLPQESFDVRMNVLVTPTRLKMCSSL